MGLILNCGFSCPRLMRRVAENRRAPFRADLVEGAPGEEDFFAGGDFDGHFVGVFAGGRAGDIQSFEVDLVGALLEREADDLE